VHFENEMLPTGTKTVMTDFGNWEAFLIIRMQDLPKNTIIAMDEAIVKF
jgi:hypothetical protein